MFKDHNSSEQQVQRPGAVPKLDLGILAGNVNGLQSSQKRQTPRQDSRFAVPSANGQNSKTPTSARHNTHPSHRSLMVSSGNKHGEARAASSHTSSQSPESAGCASKNYLGRTKSNESAGNLTARQSSYSGSYKDILLTPRGMTTPRGICAEASLGPSRSRQAPNPQTSTPRLLSPTSSSSDTKQTKPKNETQAPSQTQGGLQRARSTPTDDSHAAHHRTLSAQTERAAHEQDHVALQISTVQTTISAQQDALLENLAAAHSLAERRDALSSQAIELQAALSKARQAAARRRAECEEAEVALEALKASLEITKAEEAAGAANAAAARSSLLRIMGLAAKSLKLGGVSKALDVAVSDAHTVSVVAGSARMSAACTARSDLSTSRFDTPTAGSVAEGDSARSASSDSCASDHTGEGSPVAPKAPVAPVTKVPSVVLPRLHLPGTIPAVLPASNTSAPLSARTTSHVSPAALARLASIRSKLNQAESILSARIVVPDE